VTQPSGPPSLDDLLRTSPDPAPVGQAPLVAAPPPPVPVAAAVAPRFCNVCGAPWQIDWFECHACAAKRYHGRNLPPPDRKTGNAPVTSALALYFSFLGISVIAIVCVLAGARSVTLEFVMSALASLLVLIWCLARRGEVAPALTKPVGPQWLGVAVLGSLATFSIATGAVYLMHRLLGVAQLRMSDDFIHQGYGFPIIVLIIAVQPGIIEELAFRGVILGGLRHVLSPLEAVIVSAAMFMIIHLAVPSFPHLFVMGLALGWLRVYTGSLYPGMVLHFCHNLLCILWEYWSR
jgi:membrane protease YdiL (CAAX protease family)